MQGEALLKANVIKKAGGPSLAELEARANHTGKKFLKLGSCTEGQILVRRQGNTVEDYHTGEIFLKI
jgi:hypothetical protein